MSDSIYLKPAPIGTTGSDLIVYLGDVVEETIEMDEEPSSSRRWKADLDLDDGTYDYLAVDQDDAPWYEGEFEIKDGKIVRLSTIRTTQIVHTGTAQTGAAATITLATSASSSNQFYRNCFVRIVVGTGAGQLRFIQEYNGATRVAAITPNWVTNPDSSSVYEIVPFGRVSIGAWLDSIPGELISGNVPAQVEAIDATVKQSLRDDQIVTTGTAQAGTTSTITLASGAASTDLYANCFVRIISGTGVGQTRLISQYVGSTRVATVTPDWVTTPDATSVYEVLPFGRVPLGLWLDQIPNALVSGNVQVTLGGDGPWALSVNVSDSETEDPINGATVRVVGNGEGWRVNTLDGTSNFSLESGTYTVAVGASGYEGHMQDVILGENTVIEVELDPIAIPEAPEENQCTGVIRCYDGKGTLEEGTRIYFRLSDPGTSEEDVFGAHNRRTWFETSDAFGLVTTTLRKTSTYEIKRDRGSWASFDTSDDLIQNIEIELLGEQGDVNEL